jgi:peptidyl-prolyl cis-trans isomerase D
MLSKIRKNLKAYSVPLWIVAASFVGTIFLVWGKGAISGSYRNSVATVNGEGIDLVEFNREYNSLVRELKQQFGENFRKLFPEKRIKLTALQRLITRKLLLQAAKEEGIKVSDWAVAKEIMESPLFKKDGKFSVELYEEFLKANRLTKHTFEEMVREDLTIQKLLEVINRSPSVTEYEVKELYKETLK